MTQSNRTVERVFSRSRFAALVLALATLFAVSPAEAIVAPASGSNSAANALNDPAVRQFVQDAQKAMRNGNPGLAAILLKNALNVAPKNAMVRAQLGIVLLRSGDPAGAERELRQARADGAVDALVLPALLQTMLSRHEEKKLLTEFPEPAPNATGLTAIDILRARALAFQALDNPSEAAAAMDKALALRRDVAGLVGRARLAEQQGDLPLAKKLSEEALKLAPNSPEALLLKLGLMMLANDRPGALALANKLTQQFPDNLSLKIARIELAIQLKQDRNVSADIDALLAKSPNSPILLYFKALILARSNDVKGAWHIAQSLPPSFTQSQPSIAIVVSQMAIGSGNVETGAAILNAVLAKSPNLVDVRLRLAGIRLGQKSPEAALSVLQPLKDSNDPRALALLSQAYLNLHQYNNALNALGRLNAAGGGSAGLKRELALVEMQSGQSDQAIRDLMELADKAPNDPTVVAPLIAALGQAKRFDEAVAVADRLGTDPKQRVQAYFFRGQTHVLQGDGNAALADFENALRLNPKYIAALYYRSGLLEVRGRYADADRDLVTILQTDPKNIMAHVRRAEIAARQGQDKNARDLLARAIAAAPHNPVPRIALARYLITRHEYKAALATAAETVRLNPTNTEALTLLGQLQLGQGQKAQSVATFRRLGGLIPKSANAQLLLANALFVSGDQLGASSALNAAATSDPNSLAVRAAQIGLMLSNHDVTGAIRSARAFQAANPGTAPDLLLANTLIKAKELSQAAAVLARSLTVKPDNRVVSLLAQVVAATGDKKHAENVLADWLNGNPRDVVIRAQYGTILMQDGEKAKATDQFELILHQSPSNITALNNLAWLLQKDDPKRALALSGQAYKLYPNAADVVDTFGWLKFQMRDVNAALPLLKRAHDLRPNDGEITYHLVLALDAGGNRSAAKSLLKNLLNNGSKFDHIVDALKLSESWN